jgi:cytochrome bd-type quinol oxidase subunit 2
LNPETAKSWADVASTTGGWGIAVILGVVLGSVIIWLARQYITLRNRSEQLLIDMIKEQTALLTANKIQNDQVVALMNRVVNRLEP